MNRNVDIPVNTIIEPSTINLKKILNYYRCIFIYTN